MPPTNGAERALLFQSLIVFISVWDCSDYIIFGDFNVILGNKETWGNNGFSSASEELVSFVDDLELQNMPLLGLSFTFYDSGQFGARNRLDRFFISVDVGEWSYNVVRRAIFQMVSDHIPIVFLMVVGLQV